LLESRPGPTADELSSTLTSLFTGILGVADRTTVTCAENHIRVEIYKPRIENRNNQYPQCLGGPLASIAASVTAEAWDKPVTIKAEAKLKGKYSIELEVIE